MQTIYHIDYIYIIPAYVFCRVYFVCMIMYDYVMYHMCDVCISICRLYIIWIIYVSCMHTYSVTNHLYFVCMIMYDYVMYHMCYVCISICKLYIIWIIHVSCMHMYSVTNHLYV